MLFLDVNARMWACFLSDCPVSTSAVTIQMSHKDESGGIAISFWDTCKQSAQPATPHMLGHTLFSVMESTCTRLIRVLLQDHLAHIYRSDNNAVKLTKY